MGILLALIAGLVVWLVGWALGYKAFDAFLITVLFLILAVAGHMLARFMPGNRPEEQPGGRWTPR
jgi:uncharacterized membrane protein